MSTDRVTVSLDENAHGALEDLMEKTGQGQRELVRHSLNFYAQNFQAANADSNEQLEKYYKMLSGGEHVLLDVDFSYDEFGAGVSALDEGTQIDYSGPSGTVDYDDNGDVASDMVIVEVVDGEFQDQETIPADELV